MEDAESLFTWIHLSDLHFGYRRSDAQYDQALVLNRLREDIGAVTSRGAPAPNAVVVTGDIAFSGGALPCEGSQRGEYEQADELFGAIAALLTLDKKDFFLVPGNHDVQRAPVSSGQRRLLEAVRDARESIDDTLTSPEDAQLVERRFANYRAFAAKYGPQSGENASAVGTWVHDITGLPIELRLIGLNTALVAHDDSDRGRLVVGKKQLADVIASRTALCGHLSIVLTHHPLDWCRDCDDLRRWLESLPCVHLSGHIHENSSSSSQLGSGSRHVHIGAGAAHSSDTGIRGHGYNVMSLVRKGNKVVLRVWPRRWADKAKAFRLDVENVPDQQEYVDHPLEVVGRSEADPRSSKEAIAKRPAILPVRADDSSIVGTRIPVRRTGSSCDVPPCCPAWIGRESELSCAADSSFHVVAITGIGGQGKSVLAAEHIERAMKVGRYEGWDWRDCREEGDTLHAHLVRIVERFGAFGLTPRELTGLRTNELIALVGDVVAERSCVFVLDNVDHYVDVESHRTTGALDLLIRDVLRRASMGRLIITCRPKIQYDETTFFHLPLAGLTSADTIRLFSARGAKDASAQMREQIERACQVTKGHPLWLNLIAVQVAKKGANLKELLDRVEQGQSTELPVRMLDALWVTLKDEHKSLLRLMAELVRPESEQHIGEMASADMNWNQFGKALRSACALDLVVTKKIPGAPDLLELHPLVREYLRRCYRKHDRKPFIAKVASVLDRLIAKLKPKVIGVADFSMLDIWTQRAEVAINAGLYDEAIKAIQDIQPALLAGGYAEEFVRTASRLLNELDWNEAIANEFKGFGELIIQTATTLAQLGRPNENASLLNRYEEVLGGRGAAYIALCDARCYSLWCQGRFEEAVDWGRRGVELKQSSGLDTGNDCSHSLALARRDSGNPEAALPVFLCGKGVEDVLAPGSTEHASVFGNVGRCLWLLGRYEEALACYRRSAELLERDVTDGHDLLNQGYIRMWIGEALERLGRIELAHGFFRAAEKKWERISPPRAADAKIAAERTGVASLERSGRDKSDCLDVEGYCREWIRSNATRGV